MNYLPLQFNRVIKEIDKKNQVILEHKKSILVRKLPFQELIVKKQK